MDIAKLRFWLSLVVDEEIPQPLPNLDFKIICANTLIPLGELENTLLIDDSIITELERLRHEYFTSNQNEKNVLENKFKLLQNNLLNNIAHANKEQSEVLQKLYSFNPFSNESNSWFDAWWMFGVKDGFDILIGNPPYVQLQKDGGKLAKLYQPIKYETFERTGDIYSLFYEKGVQLLKDNGILCYITSNKWMRANYGVSTRQFFAEKTHPLLLIDFGNVQVFETATVDTNILFLQNKPKARKYETKQTFAVRFTKDFDLANQSINDFIYENGYYLTSLNQNSWVVGEKDIYNIKAEVEKQGVELLKWNINFCYGLKTGFNEAFIIDGISKDKLIKDDPKSKEIIKPILRGKDISAWYPEFEDYWLINSHNGVKSKSIKRIDVKRDYPSIYKWLKKFEEQLQKRQDKGDDWTNLRNCAYIEEFENPKIIFPNMTKYLPFVYDETGIYTNQKCFIITGEHLKYLTCFLNSKLFKYCFSDNFPELQGGTRELSKVFFDKIPVKQITNTQETPFAKIVDYLVALKKENSQEPTDQFMFIFFEQIANALVYELYFKEEFEKAGLAVASYVEQLPEIDKKSKESVILQIRKTYLKAHEEGSPIRNAVECMTTIPQINLINNNITI